MSFIDDGLNLLRALIDDMDSDDYEFSDDRLITLLLVAANYVNMDINETYTISFCAQTVTPDPDSTFINLCAYKAACLLIRSQHTSFARNDFRVTDGPTSVDLKNSADKLKVAADSICDQYDRLKFGQIMGEGGYGISTPNSES